MRVSIHSHFQDSVRNKAMLIATALDPRHRSLKFLKSADKESVFEDVITEASSLADTPDATSSSPKRPKLSLAAELLDYSESSDSSI